MNTWFQKHGDDVLHEQQVVLEHGLTTEEAKKRFNKFGPNQLESGKKINPLKLFASQFKDVLIIILIIAAVVSWGVGLVGGSEQLNEEEISHVNSMSVVCSSPAVLDSIGYGSELTTHQLQCEEFRAEYTCPVKPNYTATECVKNIESEGAQEALLILAIVIAIAVIGFFNEYKAEKTVEALKKLVGQKATVRRNGKSIEVDASEVVPGDIVLP